MGILYSVPFWKSDDLLPIVAIGTSERVNDRKPAKTESEPADEPEPEWFCVSHAAKMMNICAKRLSTLCRQGKIACRDDSDPSKLRRAYKIHIDTINSFNGIPKR